MDYMRHRPLLTHIGLVPLNFYSYQILEIFAISNLGQNNEFRSYIMFHMYMVTGLNEEVEMSSWGVFY